MYQRWPSPRVQWQNHRYAYPNQDLRWRCSERWRSGANQIVKPGMGRVRAWWPSWTAGHGKIWLKLAISLMVNDGHTVQTPDFAASSGKSAFASSSFTEDRELGIMRGDCSKPPYLSIFGGLVTSNPSYFWGGEQTGQVWLFDPSLFETRWG